MSLIKRFGRRLAAFSAIAATACASPAVEPREASPALWKVADADTTVFLFGTIHLLPKDTSWRSPAFEDAVKSSDILVLETVIDEKNPAPVFEALAKLGVSPGLPPLAERMKPEKRVALAQLIAKSGAPADAYDRMETWAAGYLLLLVQLGQLGLDPGVETAIKAEFNSAGKPIDQLETNAEQLGFFDGLPEADQRAFLEGVLEDPAQMKVQLTAMVEAWSRGDVKAIARTFGEEFQDSPELKKALLLRRNANWASWVKGRMDKPGTVLVAVGAGHLAGDGSVLHLLEKQGLKVTRIQ
jgi:uncharacterized protein YbaP (TraB family)